MSTGYWKLNGNTLQDAAVQIIPLADSNSFTTRIRQSLVNIHGGSQKREKTGIDLATMSLEINFYGAHTQQKWEKLQQIADILETDDVWTLEAPDGREMRLFKNKSRAAFSATSHVQANMGAHGVISLKIDAIVNGIWIADGGTYEECFSGFFTLTTASPTSYTKEDGTTNGGTTATIELPPQTAGYPKAVRTGDFAKVTLSPISTRIVVTPDGYSLIYGTYQLDGGYLHPAPSVAGDVGAYEICQSPSRIALSGGIDNLAADSGIAAEMVGGGMTGS